MMNKLLAKACIAVFLSCVTVTNADTIPVGVQNDVLVSDVTGNWGWSILYQGDYGDTNITLNSIFQNAGQYVMLAAKHVNSSRFDVLAAALTTDVQTWTTWNATHAANGSEWYYNGYSMGFVGPGDTIYQVNADVAGLTERDRLSWHTDLNIGANPYNAPTYLSNGWRSGTNNFLNYSHEWERFVLTYTPHPVPTPSAFAAMAGMGAVSVLGCARFRSKSAKGTLRNSW